jgi:hypothetical protein
MTKDNNVISGRSLIDFVTNEVYKYTKNNSGYE